MGSRHLWPVSKVVTLNKQNLENLFYYSLPCLSICISVHSPCTSFFIGYCFLLCFQLVCKCVICICQFKWLKFYDIVRRKSEQESFHSSRIILYWLTKKNPSKGCNNCASFWTEQPFCFIKIGNNFQEYLNDYSNLHKMEPTDFMSSHISLFMGKV